MTNSLARIKRDTSIHTTVELDSSLRHLEAELARVDVLLHREVRHWQLAGQDPSDAFRGLYVSDAEASALLQLRLFSNWGDTVALGPEEEQALAEAKAKAVLRVQTLAEEGQRQGRPVRLVQLAETFNLDRFETDALLICLAPELDLRYERLYAYLQDDVTKKRPSVDLVLNLLSPSIQARLAARKRFAPESPLLKHHLLHLFDDPSHHWPPLLSKYLKVDERVVNYLLGSDELDARLLPYAQHAVPRTRLEDLLLPADAKRRLALLTKESEKSEGLIFYFQGPYGVGKQTTAEALCRELGVGLLAVDGEWLLNAEDKEVVFETAVRLATREALLQNAALYWAGFDALLADDKRAWREALVRQLENRRGLTFLAGNTTWEPSDALHELPFVRVEFPRPTYAERLQLWATSLDGSVPQGIDPSAALRQRTLRPRSGQGSGQAVDLRTLANKFRFTGGQIRDAAATARNLARWRDPENRHVTTVTMADLYTACRLQSNRKLGALATKITPHYTWDDIVLPPDRMQQLREICNTVKHRALVYHEWGFDRKLSLGKGLNVLFAGPSGTGKTMAAEIMANELGLDLYKIDLSTVVSKYIGETEKNLARIFAEAETSNAILFFDEADALFGKRSEVRDSHDRYANIEISYLLQKMEEYEGVTILATNLRRNLDDAFVRRLAFTVHFPFPEEEDRQCIWRGIWPPETPRADVLDLTFMARQFKLTGGNIRNIALAATFLAADDGQVVGMDHLIWATRRELQKMGKAVVEREFGEYAECIRRET